MRTATVVITLKDAADTCLAWEVEYQWSGKYRPATREEPEEYPEVEVLSARLVEVNECEPTADDREHYEHEWDGIYADQFHDALIEIDAIDYPQPSRDDVRYFGCESY